MSVHVVLLRAINVGGHNRIPMAELRDLLVDHDFADVSTYVQSGNVVCSSPLGGDEVASTIRAAIQDRFGHDVAVVVRSPADLQRIVASFPYAAADPKQCGVVFLADTFGGALDASALAPDECAVDGVHVYVHCPTTFAKTKLTNAWVEAQTGSAGTMRNWNTVLKLAEMAGATAI